MRVAVGVGVGLAQPQAATMTGSRPTKSSLICFLYPGVGGRREPLLVESAASRTMKRYSSQRSASNSSNLTAVAKDKAVASYLARAQGPLGRPSWPMEFCIPEDLPNPSGVSCAGRDRGRCPKSSWTAAGHSRSVDNAPERVPSGPVVKCTLKSGHGYCKSASEDEIGTENVRQLWEKQGCFGREDMRERAFYL